MNREDFIRMAHESHLDVYGLGTDYAKFADALERFAALVASAERERIKQANAPEIERINSYIKKLEALAQTDYKSTSDYQFMENIQGELELIKLVQTGVGIEQRAEEAYEAAKQRSWVGVFDEMAQPEPWEKFCDSNCVWTDHHPDCKLAQRTWVGLTLDERLELADDVDWPAGAYCEYAEKIEAKLRSKNHDT